MRNGKPDLLEEASIMTQRVKIANLTKAQLEKVRVERLQSAEKELDLVLLAYERT
jgi:hypothetical protein